jgi:hypothetical protein
LICYRPGMVSFVLCLTIISRTCLFDSYLSAARVLVTKLWAWTSPLYSPSDPFCFIGLHESLSLREHLRGMEGTTDDMYSNPSHQFINHILHQTPSVYSLLNSTIHSNRAKSQTDCYQKQTLLPGILSIFVCNNTHLGQPKPANRGSLTHITSSADQCFTTRPLEGSCRYPSHSHTKRAVSGWTMRGSNSGGV